MMRQTRVRIKIFIFTQTIVCVIFPTYVNFTQDSVIIRKIFKVFRSSLKLIVFRRLINYKASKNENKNIYTHPDSCVIDIFQAM